QCATSPAKATQLVTVVTDLVDELCNSGVTAEELSRAKRSMYGSMLLGLEDSGARGARLGISETLRGSVTPISDYLAAIDAVTQEQVLAVAQGVLGSPRVLAAVGPSAQGNESPNEAPPGMQRLEGLEFLL
ncbi:MAG: hypothetical protein WD029_11290, partial [Microthrixaceae bacterium]